MSACSIPDFLQPGTKFTFAAKMVLKKNLQIIESRHFEMIQLQVILINPLRSGAGKRWSSWEHSLTLWLLLKSILSKTFTNICRNLFNFHKNLHKINDFQSESGKHTKNDNHELKRSGRDFYMMNWKCWLAGQSAIWSFNFSYPYIALSLPS